MAAVAAGRTSVAYVGMVGVDGAQRYGAGHEDKDTVDNFDKGLLPTEQDWGAFRQHGQAADNHAMGLAGISAAPHYGSGHENKDTDDNFDKNSMLVPEVGVALRSGEGVVPKYGGGKELMDGLLIAAEDKDTFDHLEHGTLVVKAKYDTSMNFSKVAPIAAGIQPNFIPKYSASQKDFLGKPKPTIDPHAKSLELSKAGIYGSQFTRKRVHHIDGKAVQRAIEVAMTRKDAEAAAKAAHRQKRAVFSMDRQREHNAKMLAKKTQPRRTRKQASKASAPPLKLPALGSASGQAGPAAYTSPNTATTSTAAHTAASAPGSKKSSRKSTAAAAAAAFPKAPKGAATYTASEQALDRKRDTCPWAPPSAGAPDATMAKPTFPDTCPWAAPDAVGSDAIAAKPDTFPDTCPWAAPKLDEMRHPGNKGTRFDVMQYGAAHADKDTHSSLEPTENGLVPDTAVSQFGFNAAYGGGHEDKDTESSLVASGGFILPTHSRNQDGKKITDHVQGAYGSGHVDMDTFSHMPVGNGLHPDAHTTHYGGRDRTWEQMDHKYGAGHEDLDTKDNMDKMMGFLVPNENTTSNAGMLFGQSYTEEHESKDTFSHFGTGAGMNILTAQRCDFEMDVYGQLKPKEKLSRGRPRPRQRKIAYPGHMRGAPSAAIAAAAGRARLRSHQP